MKKLLFCLFLSSCVLSTDEEISVETEVVESAPTVPNSEHRASESIGCGSEWLIYKDQDGNDYWIEIPNDCSNFETPGTRFTDPYQEEILVLDMMSKKEVHE